jgi:colanic acid biosynthesis glycosyl transferase WcaI
VKVLLLNQAFYPDIVATALQASDLAARLVERGHEVTVLCGRRGYDDQRQQYKRSETWRGVRIRRVSSLGLGKTARWRRALDFFSYWCSCFIQLPLFARFDLVIAMTSPPLISGLGALVARVKRASLIFWVMDLNPDEAVAAGWLQPHAWTTRLLEALLRYGLHQAETVVVLDRYMASRIEGKGIPPGKIAVLPPWSQDHLVHYDAEGRLRFRREHQLSDKFVVMYSGNHSPCHPLTTLLEAARRLEDRSDIVFCFVGGGSEFETVRRLSRNVGRRTIRTIPYQPTSGLAASLSSADLHVVVMGDPFVGIVHPSKVYNIRALGIPYLYIGPAESHIGELQPTFAADHGAVDVVVRHIRTAADSRIPRMPAAEDRNPHSHERLVTKMILALEAAAARKTAA